ncbi:MAG TPA: hypothetical protein VJN65_07620 [Bacteroidota bacterium]|nr:hypothetical protein [Bacteroidota bacterium]
MRRILIAASIILQQGCASFHELTKEEIDKGMISDEAAIRVLRVDGSVIESRPYRHALIQEPSDFVVGSGVDRVTQMPFAGKVLRSEIDSTRQIGMSSQGTHFIVWRKHNASLLFEENEYLDITPEYQTGLWCVGTVTEHEQTRLFKGRIDSSTIRRIETNRWGNPEGANLFTFSLPTSGGPAKGQYRWASLGIGPLSTDRDRGAFLVSYSAYSKGSLYTVRFTTTFPQIGTPGGGSSPAFSVYELAAMYGFSLKSQFLAASISAGISYAGGSEQISLQPNPGYKTADFSTVSLPLELELSFTPMSAVGIGVKFYATSNSRKSWTGSAFCLHIGEL